MSPLSFREREQARQQERAAFERGMRRMFWIGLTVPALVFAVVALAVQPDTLLGWLAAAATIPATAACIAMVYAYRSRESR